jgi:peptide/nickel transport system substrate-binding protein
MSNKQSILKLVLIATICSLVLIACAPQTPTQKPSADTAVPQDTQASSGSSGGGQATAIPVPSATPLVGDTLVASNNGKPAPGLALSWTISEDRLDYVFTLKTGATFADGSAVTADAVVANFNRWFDPSDPAHASGPIDAWMATFGGFKGEKDATGKPKGSFDGIEKVDNFTVLVHLNRPYDDLLTALAQPDFGIVSPALFKK